MSGLLRVCDVLIRFKNYAAADCITTFQLAADHDIDWTGGEGQDIADQLGASGAGGWADDFRAILTPNSLLSDIKVVQTHQPGTSPGGLHEALHSIAAAGTGTSGDQKVPAAASVVITKQTARTGRRFRGRMFLPGAENSAYIGGNNWLASSAYLTAVQAFVDKVAPLSTMRLVVFSKPEFLAGGSNVGEDVTSLRTNLPVHWLRSRRPH
jgi:hypothetical protein